jgi:hypothetical protein
MHFVYEGVLDQGHAFKWKVVNYYALQRKVFRVDMKTLKIKFNVHWL